jgi:phenylalanyl-tRNA synthetase beta subunit
MDRSLTDEEINDLQERVRASLTEDLKVELR